MKPQRLSTLDAGFLEAEDADRHASMAIGVTAVIEGPAPTTDALLTTLDERVRRIPRCTQVLRSHPLDLSAPEWVPDDAFDVHRHVRRIAVPQPADDQALYDVVAELMERRLDRGRPLWECWVVDGLGGGHWALVLKVHHSVADGIAAGTMLAAFTDADIGEDADIGDQDHPAGISTPTSRKPGFRLPDLNPVTLVTNGFNSSRDTLRTAYRIISGAAEIAAGIVTPAQQKMTGPLTDLRKYSAARVSLTEIKSVCERFGVTVNDVALAAITDSFRQAMTAHGQPIRPTSLRTLVPVSLRKPEQLHVPDNRVSVLLPLLPVDQDDPVQRLRTVHDRLTKSKSGGQSQAGDAVVTVSTRLPFPVTAWAVRLLTRLPQRGVVTVATNVPGPRRPLAMMGREVLSLLPIPPMAIRLRLAIAITSYADELAFGVIGDFDANIQADEIARGIEAGIKRLTTGSGAVGDGPLPEAPAVPRPRRVAEPTTPHRD